MAETLRRYHSDAQLTVLLLDGDPEHVEPIDGAELLGLAAVVAGEPGVLAAANAPDALRIAVLPYVVEHVLRAGARSVLYVDAAQRVVGPLGRILEGVHDHSITLVARAGTASSPDILGDDPARGVYSRKIFGFAGPDLHALLDAWPRFFRVANDAGAASVRRWVDSMPALGSHVSVLRDATYALDQWSLAELASSGLEARAKDGENLVVGTGAASLLDFTDLDPRSPSGWFAGGARVGPDLVPALGALVEQHAGNLRAAGWETDARHPIPFERLGDGLRLTSTLRDLLVDAIRDGRVTRSPFKEEGRREFYEYLCEPGDRGRGAGLSRLHMAIWRARPDLRAGYRQLDGPDGAGFAGWLSVHGAEQEGLVADLLPPVPEVAYRDADPHVQEAKPRWGVNVAGFFTSELGVGEAARLLVAGLDAQEIPALPIQGHLIPPSRQEISFSYVEPDRAAYPINILCINGDGVSVFAREAGRSFFEDRYSIALWWWEAGEPPASWKAAYEFVDEVWVASQHVYDLLAPTSPVPVVRIRLPLTEPRVAQRTRSQLGLPDDGFLFVCMHDYHSVAARKNPVAVIEAYRRAFPDPSAARLAVKSINAGTEPAEHARVVLAAEGRDDIRLIDEYVSDSEKDAMIAAADCFVSLHRSEGFGIPLAEAMLLGKPVIATRYGGSLEFMTEQNSYLVDWTPVPVGEGAYPYAPQATWADPDLDHAATLMRHVLESPDAARERGARARRELQERHSPAAAGAIIGQRLSIIRDILLERGQRSLNLAHIERLDVGGRLRELMVAPPEFDWDHDRFDRLKWSVYLPVVKWARAYVEHQKKVDAQTAALLDSIDNRSRRVAREVIEQLEAQHAENLALIRRMSAELDELREEHQRRP
jgi:glycosyltransferase involved in cell wall biosynthesis